MEKEVRKLGTTTVGIKSKDAVILAADKRATMGSMVASREVEKIVKITDYMALTTAGAVGDAQALVRLLRAELELYENNSHKKPSVKAAATLLANILFQQRMSFIPYYVQLILAGYDNLPHIFSLDAGGSAIEEKYTSTGSGSPFAYGVLEDNYKENLSTEDTIKLAAKAVSAATKRDVYSGEGIDVWIVNKKGIKKLKKEEIDKVLKG